MRVLSPPYFSNLQVTLSDKSSLSDIKRQAAPTVLWGIKKKSLAGRLYIRLVLCLED